MLWVEGDYQLRVTFTNGEIGIYDCRPLLDFGVFKELRDVRYFRQVRVENGTIAWPHEQDICPDTVYLTSTRVHEVEEIANCKLQNEESTAHCTLAASTLGRDGSGVRTSGRALEQ